MLQGPSLEACLKPARSFYTRFKFSEVKKNNKKKRKGGWEQIVYWSPTALRAHPLHARTDSYIQWDLMPFFPLPPFLEIIATASTNMWKGLPETQKLYIKAPSKTEVCFAHGLDSQQTSQARGREWGAGEQRWLIRRTDNAFRDQRAQEFYGSCMGNWRVNMGSDTSTGETASDLKHQWLITATTIYTSWRPAPRSPALLPPALTARDRWLLQVRFFVLVCQA